MYQGKLVFSQLMSFIQKYDFNKCVSRYRGHYKIRRFSCWDQFLCMAFAQLTYRESLREIVTCLGAMQNKLYHLGFRSHISRSTLADANENRDWRIYADFAQLLINDARKLYSDDHVFHAFTYYTYLRLPYNIKSIYNNCAKGYYLESIILLRHVVEGLVQVRYFHNNREKLNVHLLATRSRDRIQFRTMFEEIVPGFYNFIYGKLFSRFSHGHLVTSLFRAKYETPKKGNLIYGCQFIENYCKLILEQLFTYCYGFLNYFEVFSPKFPKSADHEMINEYKTTVSEIREIILSPRSTQEFQEGFEKYLLPFIEYK